MDTCGRRTLVLWSASGMLASCVLVTMALYEVVPNVVALLGVGTEGGREGGREGCFENLFSCLYRSF